jgi:hypothetical protein
MDMPSLASSAQHQSTFHVRTALLAVVGGVVGAGMLTLLAQ